jgi:hypothetical protein
MGSAMSKASNKQRVLAQDVAAFVLRPEIDVRSS